MSGMFGGGGSPALPKVIDPPKQDDPAIEEARRKEIILARKAKGRAATMLTGGEGVTGQAPLAKKSLLGTG